MNFKGVVKNIGKFKKITLAKGFSLQYLKTEKRYGINGATTSKFGKNWFITPKGQAIFKNYDKEDSKTRVINELMYMYLAKQVGVPVAEYEPANYKNHDGLVTYNFLKDNEELMHCSEFFAPDWLYLTYTKFADYFKLVYDYKQRVDYDKICFDLFKIMVLDSLTFQEDRTRNLFVIKNEETEMLSLAPAFDNEYAFCGQSLMFDLKYFKHEIKLEDLLAEHARYMYLVASDYTLLKNKYNMYETDINQIIKLAKTKPTYSVFLKQALNKIDYQKAITSIEQSGYKINGDYKKFLLRLEKITKHFYNEYLNLNETQDQKSVKNIDLLDKFF